MVLAAPRAGMPNHGEIIGEELVALQVPRHLQTVAVPLLATPPPISSFGHPSEYAAAAYEITRWSSAAAVVWNAFREAPSWEDGRSKLDAKLSMSITLLQKKADSKPIPMNVLNLIGEFAMPFNTQEPTVEIVVPPFLAQPILLDVRRSGLMPRDWISVASAHTGKLLQLYTTCTNNTLRLQLTCNRLNQNVRRLDVMVSRTQTYQI